MGDEKLSGDVARPDAHHGELDYPASDVVGQRPAVYEDTAQLIHSCLAYQASKEETTFENATRVKAIIFLVFNVKLFTTALQLFCYLYEACLYISIRLYSTTTLSLMN